ncbi:membrane protein implicated in regulation of membrane protease activity [Pseudarthrobacter oxydans]|nr:membrane protein implicated in regulation of membrane protease activity [Pseudarthrobacter oxydans]
MRKLLLALLGVALTVAIWYGLCWGVSRLGRLETWHVGVIFIVAVIAAVMICKRVGRRMRKATAIGTTRA